MRLQKNCADPIVLTLKSRGADSSVLTVGVRMIVTEYWFGHSEQHAAVLAG
jgi:hypothetical protein